MEGKMVTQIIDNYFIIDEINRGNLSKIFGELMMLIEQDKSG
jgi:5-methylcytosine-specific restriction protein B